VIVAVTSWFLIPETAGVTVEDIDRAYEWESDEIAIYRG
jgi:SP family general alpha glucoside:H+ symporter-like MFS transporter